MDKFINAAILLGFIVLMVHWLFTRNRLAWQAKYHEGYTYGLTMCDHPADRAEAWGEIEDAPTDDPWANGAKDALLKYPHGLPRYP